ncbi:MAG TPA: ribosome small subunit-dependent GTPase A [Acidimicrobiales bacterium]|nr:ribosome small subunit-dependent GTPase A [Acidimicrobiales bacterium]
MTSDPSFDMLVELGWDERVSTLYRSVAEPFHVPARVSRVDRDRCSAHTATGKLRATADVLPATGDWVVISLDPGPAVQHILPRRSTLERAGQVLAANVDLVLVVASLDRPLNLNRVERELVLAWDSGAVPVVVLTKADASDEAAVLAETVSARAVGVEVLLTSAATGLGVDAVSALLRPNRSAVFLGPSGSGKSTLVNRLLKENRQAIGEVRAGDHKGRHTTSSRHLLVVPGGGVLIDTPGLRSVGLDGAEGGVAMTFPDVEEMAEQCRFRDCVHTNEPGCAVVAAVADGRLDRDRVASYRKLQAELEESGREPWARAAENQQGRIVHRAIKKMPKKR